MKYAPFFDETGIKSMCLTYHILYLTTLETPIPCIPTSLRG